MTNTSPKIISQTKKPGSRHTAPSATSFITSHSPRILSPSPSCPLPEKQRKHIGFPPGSPSRQLDSPPGPRFGVWIRQSLAHAPQIPAFPVNSFLQRQSCGRARFCRYLSLHFVAVQSGALGFVLGFLFPFDSLALALSDCATAGCPDLTLLHH